MLTSAIRVLARSAAIQLEEVAAAHAVHQPKSAYKGKEREVAADLGLDPRDRFDRAASPDAPRPATANEAASSGSGVSVDEEKSEEVLEVERKIAKLLERAKQREKQAATASPASTPTPTVSAHHSCKLDEEQPTQVAKRLPENARAPKTIQDRSAPAAPSPALDNSQSLPLPEMTRVPRTIQPRSTPPAASQHPGAPETMLDVPSTSSGACPIASSSTAPSTTSLSSTEQSEVSTSTKNEQAQSEILDALEQLPEEGAPVVLRASKVPSSRIGRLFHYGSLAASLSLGAASESIRRSTGRGGTGSVFMSDANVRRLVATLGRMRGAALKLGQFMSIQDNHMLPPEIEKVLQQVQAHANYMPDWQMEKVMSEELGSEWQSLFSSFDRTPIASASIGQVHRATLSTGETVAVKIQFPGIKESIASDLGNLSLLLRSSALLPPGLYLQNTIAVMSRELEDECDYVREGESGSRFNEMLAGDEFFVVPRVFEQATRGRVLTSEWMSGKPLSRMQGMSQATRDKIGTNILRLCLQELFQFRFMQTDPNWANFLYDQKHDKIQLIDFGASREYTKEFMDGWFRLLKAALEGDRGVMKAESESLGYLTGEENDEMLQAHLDSMALVASPFAHRGAYDFTHQTITDSVRALIPVMLKHRLTPPPSETYSLNRKLSGAFLMCARLGARVDCGKLWEEHVAGYKEG